MFSTSKLDSRPSRSFPTKTHLSGAAAVLPDDLLPTGSTSLPRSWLFTPGHLVPIALRGHSRSQLNPSRGSSALLTEGKVWPRSSDMRSSQQRRDPRTPHKWQSPLLPSNSQEWGPKYPNDCPNSQGRRLYEHWTGRDSAESGRGTRASLRSSTEGVDFAAEVSRWNVKATCREDCKACIDILTNNDPLDLPPVVLVSKQSCPALPLKRHLFLRHGADARACGHASPEARKRIHFFNLARMPCSVPPSVAKLTRCKTSCLVHHHTTFQYCHTSKYTESTARLCL